MQESKLGLKIYYLTKLIRKQIEQNRNDTKFTGMQGQVLHYLLGQKDDCDIFQKDIEYEFQIKRSTATELLQSLEEKQYIKRIPTSYDARLKRIYLLDKAKQLAPEVEGVLSDIDETIMQNIEKQDLDTFVHVLDQMIDNMKKAG